MPNKGEFPQDLRAFKLHITMRGFKIGSSTGSNDQRPSIQGNADFAFSLPFHAGQILTPHDTITINGSEYTLYQVIITPSMTSLYVSGMRSDQVSSYSLSLRGKEIQASGVAAGPDVVPANQAPYTVFTFNTSQPFHQHGTLILTINESQTFTVTLP